MLKLQSSSPANASDDNLIPLINVVFLMLIFFMIAGHIARSDVIKTDPPLSVNDQKLAEQETIEILASASGALYLDHVAVTREQLGPALEQRMAAVDDLDQLSVRIKTDATLPVSELQQLLREIRASGLVRVSLITRLVEETQPLQLADSSSLGGGS